MRYFLILLLSVSTFCARSQVVIPDNVARFFLEKHEENYFLKQLDTINRMRIDNLNEIIVNKDSIILNYRLDSVAFEEIFSAKDTITMNISDALEQETKLNTGLRFQRDLALGVGSGILVGSVFGQPIPGAIIGGATVIIMRVIKRKHGDKSKDKTGR